MNYYPASSAQQGFGQQMQAGRLHDEDIANLILGELKRFAREYTTAALESSNPSIRHTFEQLVAHTLRDQNELYRAMSQNNMYGQPTPAQQQEVQKELQKQSRTLGELQTFLQQTIGGGASAAYGQQPQSGSYPTQPAYGYASGNGAYGSAYGQEGYASMPRSSYAEPQARSATGAQSPYETLSQQSDAPSAYQTRSPSAGAYSNPNQQTGYGGLAFDSSFPLNSSGSSGGVSGSVSSSYGTGASSSPSHSSATSSGSSSSAAASAGSSYQSASHGADYNTMDSTAYGGHTSGSSDFESDKKGKKNESAGKYGV
ncbi:spore coat protein [Paenibacillus flagellatus]|uniref:Spore coat protein n=1 Tax=Paenibacillus flagellatus TaxID=2211139 RepID=A0A2V5JWP6_9BACL|nr:spore coat protein [Paenibacillus flagellatus]PYI51229.1 hypothetical protein DLM86_26470 [Paenibacillus flagellatus]